MRAVARLLTDHIGTSLAIGGLMSWWFQEWWLIGVALLTGWLIDADHLVDFTYFLMRRRSGSFDLSMVTTGAYFKLSGKVIVPLHSWELVFLWTVIWAGLGYSAIAITGAVAWTVHLLHDQFSYRVTPLGYLFSYRAKRHFAHAGFCGK